MNKSSENKDVQEQGYGLRLWMSGTGRRLIRWEKNGLISRDQIFSIMDFEKGHNGKRMIRALFGIALFAIGLGVLSIVAANWMHIPGGMKVALHLMLNICAAYSILRFAREGSDLWREGATFLFFALNLTLIVLIGQVYQLDGNHALALTTWLVISSPAVFLFGKSLLNAIAWVAALLFAIWANLLNLFDLYEVSGTTMFLTWFATGLYVPLAMMAAGANKFVRETRPDWAHTLFRMSMVIFAVGATCGSFAWYGDMGRDLTRMFEHDNIFTMGYGAMVAIFATAIAAVYGFEWFKKQKGHAILDRTGIIFVVGSLISATLPMLVMAGDNNFVAAVHFMAYWGFAGWVGYRMDYRQLMNAAVALITLRLIVIYFELFGGLMMTGFGLIFSGVLTLGILKGALSVRQKLIGTGE